jgi:hypothetical protein
MKGRVVLVLGAVAAALVPLPPGFVEREYSVRCYPLWQPLVTSASNLVPFSLLDVLVAALLGAWLFAVGRDRRRNIASWARLAGNAAVRTVVWAAALYLAFLFLWGLNYRRQPLTDRLEYQPDAVSSAAARVLASRAVDELNALHGSAHQVGWAPPGALDTSLAEAFARVQNELGVGSTVVVARPKTTILNFYFRRAGVTGMTDPYFLETLVARDLLPYERPFVVAHEWSHVAGFAEESEASFIGWLTCLRGSPSAQYSGWLFLHDELIDALSGDERRLVDARLNPGPRADLQAVIARVRDQVSPRVASAGLRVYDQYLKANSVEAGVASYQDVVRLVLGVRFGPGWTPRLVTAG